MLSLIPLPYRILIGVGLALALFGSGVWTGAHFADQAAEVARLQKEAKDAKALAEARAHDAHAAKEAADLGRAQYLDEAALVAELQRRVAEHDQLSPEPEPSPQGNVSPGPSVPPPVALSCPGGLSDARARWLRELATAPLGGTPAPPGPSRSVRHPRAHPPAP